MEGWKGWKRAESSFLAACFQRVRDSYVASWFFGVFQTSKMSASTTTGGGGGGGGMGGALSLMGCVREASPPPQNHHHHHHHHRAFGFGELSTQNSMDPLPKEPKKRRFHPLRGLRKIFRRKSRGAADVRVSSGSGDRDPEVLRVLPREDVTTRHPAGRPEEARSRSASELLTDSCEHESVFLRKSGMDDVYAKLRGGAGKLSVSHDSVFPGEVPHTRPLSSLDSLATLERRQGRKSTEIEPKEYSHHVTQRPRISLRVLEQIKTVIENRNQLASATSAETGSNVLHNRFASHDKHEKQEKHEKYEKIDKHEWCSPEDSTQAKVNRPPPKDPVERVVPVAKEDLPQLESASLNHTAAHHRISVRPKNRRPPRRSTSQTNTSTSTITTIAEDTLDNLDHQPISTSSAASSPIESKPISITRKSSSRLSRTSDIFEELETKLPRKPSSLASLSPDSLDTSNISRTSVELTEDQQQASLHQQQQTQHQQPAQQAELIRPVSRKSSNRISKGSDVFEELEAKLPSRRSSTNRLSKSPDSLDSTSYWFSKSTEGFDKLLENEESKPVMRRLLHSISKSTDRVSKSSDSLEAIEALTSDDSIERRRCSFEFRARRASKAFSKSSENFEILEQTQTVAETMQELQKRSSISDVNLNTRGRRLSKTVSKSSESFERMSETRDDAEEEEEDEPSAKSCRRSSKRMSSESSDNLESDDRLENRRVRRTPKRVPSTSVVDIGPTDDYEEERRPTPTRKPSRLQKSSESSELGSTDTLDSERRNKSSESTETLDSLEKDLEQDRKEEEITDSVVDKREKSDSWPSKTMAADSDQMSLADGTEDTKPLITPDKFYWGQPSDTKENIDIHQLLAITIVTRMADNGNNQRSSMITYPKKKQQHITTSPPTSPVVKQEDNKIIFDNLLSSKNDEDLQNMLNGNISEVSTDTKSFKEKLIMFEKLGK